MPNGALPEWAMHLITLVGGGVGIKLFDWLNARRKMRIDGDVALQEVIDRRVELILEDDEKTINRLTSEVTSAGLRLSAMETYIGLLVEALRAADVTIPKRPDIIRPN
jgi:hypothetical protein